MRRNHPLLAFAALLVVGAVVMRDLRSIDAPASPPPDPALASDTGTGPLRDLDAQHGRSAREPADIDRMSSAGSLSGTAAPADEVRELAARLEELVRAQERKPAPYKAIAERLKDIGSPPAIDLLLATVARPDLEFERESMVFHSLLRDLDDPRVASAASMALDRVYASGRTDSPSLKGYSDLLVERGGAVGSGRVVTAVEAARAARSAASFALASSMSLSRDAAACARLAATIGSDDQRFADWTVINALGGSPYELAYEELASAAFREGVHLEVRERAIRTYANRIAPAEIRELLAMHGHRDSAEDSIIALKGIIGLASNPRVAKDVLWSETRGALTDAINASDARVRSKAREVLLDLPPVASGAMVLELEQRAARTEDEEERAELRRIVAHYTKSK